MKIEAEIRVMYPQAKKHQELPATNGHSVTFTGVRRGKRGFFPRDLERSIALLTPGSHTSSLQNYERVHACCFKSPSVQ